MGCSPWVTKDQTRLSTKAHIHYQWDYIHSPPHATFTPTYLQNFPPFPTETLYPLNNNSSISPPAAPVVKCCFSCVRLCVTLWTVAHQASLSMGFSRQLWSGLPFLLQGTFPTQGSNLHLLCLLHWQAGSLPLVLPGKPFPQLLGNHHCALHCYDFEPSSHLL